MRAFDPLRSNRCSWRGLVVAIAVLLLAPAFVAGAQEDDPEFDPDSYFSTMTWRNIGPTRGGRSVAAAGVVPDKGL